MEGAYEVIHVPVKNPDSLVMVPVVNLPIGVTFEGNARPPLCVRLDFANRNSASTLPIKRAALLISDCSPCSCLILPSESSFGGTTRPQKFTRTARLQCCLSVSLVLAIGFIIAITPEGTLHPHW